MCHTESMSIFGSPRGATEEGQQQQQGRDVSFSPSSVSSSFSVSVSDSPPSGGVGGRGAAVDRGADGSGYDRSTVAEGSVLAAPPAAGPSNSRVSTTRSPLE
jgi:hypothetical protein